MGKLVMSRGVSAPRLTGNHPIGQEITKRMGLSSLKAASDIVKGLNAANTQTLVNEVKISLQNHILEAQQSLATAQTAQATLIERISTLEQEIVSLKDWEREKQRYELKALYSGSLAYAVKESMRGSEPLHFICASCYQKGRKSILQGFTDHLGEHSLTCPDCWAFRGLSTEDGRIWSSRFRTSAASCFHHKINFASRQRCRPIRLHKPRT
jgi:Zn finger protein HypA/HybF involved in hydrogenase expression